MKYRLKIHVNLFSLFPCISPYDLVYYNCIKKGDTKMLHIKFKYRDNYSNGEWRNQECIMSSVEQCIKIYGLGVDCDYEIISVEEVK